MGHKVLHGGIFMIGSYDVMLRGKSVGRVQLTKQGLYYHIRCSCTVIDQNIYRLLGSCDGDQIRFGVLVPEGKRLILETKIPTKKLMADNLAFFLESVVSHGQSPATQERIFQYVPIYPDEPLAYLSKLKKSYFEIRNGKPGILITD